MSDALKIKPDVGGSEDAMRPTRPKVFISYSWASQDRAINLADRLLENGIEVVIDVYDLKEGMNKYAFMQRVVDDPSIEKVLLLCDKSYKEKADSFKGGVGDETMVISPEIYGKVEQQKFIPLVLEKDESGEPYLPTLFKSLIYIDFSDPLKEPDSFEKLVRNLWGKPDRRKPSLGPRPTLLDLPSVNTSSIKSQMRILDAVARTSPNPDVVLKKIAFEIIKSLNELCEPGGESCNLIDAIRQTEPIRNCYLDLLEQSILNSSFSGEKIAAMIEAIYNGIDRCGLEECYYFFFWDIFISTTAMLIGYEKYGDLHRLLNRTYFLRNLIGTNNDPSPYSFSEFRHHCRMLEGPYKQKINPRLVSLAADILVKREHGNCVTKRSLVTADTTLAHLAMLYGRAHFTWYPALAPYSHYAGYGLIWERLVSRSFCEKLFPLFNVSTFTDFKLTVKRMSDAWDGADGMRNAGMAFGGIYPVLRVGGYEKIGSLP